jgi:hypothetical protein
MRYIPFDPDNDLDAERKAWWDKWTTRANKARDALVDKRGRDEAAEFDSSIWSELKAWLLANVFHGKCAYCETKVTPGFFGDGEHYRPKGKVTVKDDQGARRAVAAADKEHPGYYWLAYDWRNLLPACQRCNNAKVDQFPVSAAHVHSAGPEPADLDRDEQPLLINPYFEDPSSYLFFGEFGVISAVNRNPRGLATIDILNLERKDLTDDRWRAQEQSVSGLNTAMGATLLLGVVGSKVIDSWIDADAQYSEAARAYLQLKVQIIMKEVFSKILSRS